MKPLQAATARWLAARLVCEGEAGTPIERIATRYAGALHAEMIEHECTQVLVDDLVHLVAVLQNVPLLDPELRRCDGKIGEAEFTCDYRVCDYEHDGRLEPGADLLAVWHRGINVFELLSDETVEALELQCNTALKDWLADEAAELAVAGVPSLREQQPVDA